MRLRLMASSGGGRSKANDRTSICISERKRIRERSVFRYVVPDENGKINIDGLKPGTEYVWIASQPEQNVDIPCKLVEKEA